MSSWNPRFWYAASRRLARLLTALLVLWSASSPAAAQESGPQSESPSQAAAALGTIFTYQGQLNSGGSPVNGACDFEFRLWDDALAGNQVGPLAARPGLNVADGLFTVSLDFGGEAFVGEARWLAISVRCPAGSGSYTALLPRQPLTPAPAALALPGLHTQQNGTSPNLIGGHISNTVANGVWGATIGGGGTSTAPNQVTAMFGTIGGGSGNTVSADSATVAGGLDNTASIAEAAVGGGSNNTANGLAATVPGGRNNVALGAYSFAAGRNARAMHADTFVWGDGVVPFTSTAQSQFLIRAAGGVGIGTNSPNGQLNVTTDGSPAWPQAVLQETGSADDYARLRLLWPGLPVYWDVAAGGTDGRFNIFRSDVGDVISLRPSDLTNLLVMSNGARLTIGGAWTNASDRNLKAEFAPVDPRGVLAQVAALPLTTWRYQAEAAGVRHMGPAAQDFRAAFGLGDSDTAISTVDADGVALAAIQGLYSVVQAQEVEIAALKEAQAASNARLAALEAGGAPAAANTLQLSIVLLAGLLAGAVIGAGAFALGRRGGGQ